MSSSKEQEIVLSGSDPEYRIFAFCGVPKGQISALFFPRWDMKP
jgi:hypothetical protein